AIEATPIKTARDGSPLHTAPGWLDAVLVFALAFVAPLVAYRLGLIVGVVAGLVAAALFLVAVQLAFAGGVILTVLPPLIAVAAAIVMTLAVGGVARAPWVDRALDRISPPRGANRRTHRVRALLL